jgi:hypothetical protein
MYTIEFNAEDYIVPSRWNQGCYDLVRILHNNTVQFIQITLAARHQLKTRYITQFLEAFEKEGKNKVERVNVVFLVPNHTVFTMPAYIDRLPNNYRSMFDPTVDCNVNTIQRWD